jgi:hypothetical protein
MASDFLVNFPYKKNKNPDINNFVKKRELILRQEQHFLKHFRRIILLFSTEQLESKMEKRREKLGRFKEEQRGLFLKEVVK